MDDPRNVQAKRWLVGHLKKKHKIPVKQTNAVLGAIADLSWDWKDSAYDLWGLGIEEILTDLGQSRDPGLKRKR